MCARQPVRSAALPATAIAAGGPPRLLPDDGTGQLHRDVHDVHVVRATGTIERATVSARAVFTVTSRRQALTVTVTEFSEHAQFAAPVDGTRVVLLTLPTAPNHSHGFDGRHRYCRARDANDLRGSRKSFAYRTAARLRAARQPSRGPPPTFALPSSVRSSVQLPCRSDSECRRRVVRFLPR